MTIDTTSGRREVIVTQLVFIGLVGSACYLSPTTYVRFIAEDYWGEYGTWAAFIIAAGLFGLCFRLARGEWLARAWYVLLSLACFFVAMEEISWGQRLFGFSMPETLARLNNQNELTLHNLVMIERITPYNTVVPLAILSYGVLIALADNTIPPVRRLLARLRVVFPQLYLAPTFILSAYLVSAPIAKSSELGELLAGIGMALLACEHAHIRLGMRKPTPKIWRWVLGTYIFLLAVCIFGGFVLVPALIEAAYNGESFDVINDVINGRSIYPVETYLAAWAPVPVIGLTLLAFAGIVAAPFVHRLWSAKHSWMTRATGPTLVACALSFGIFATEMKGSKDSFDFELNALADRAVESGHYERASSILSYIEAHSLAPRPDVFYRKALLLQGSGREDEAMELFEEALELELAASGGEVSTARSQRLGQINARLGRSRVARQHWMQTLSQYDAALDSADSNKDRTSAYLGRAATYRLMQDHNAAITEYVRAGTVAVLGARKKQIWLGIGEVLAGCQPEELRKGPRWDFGTHWDRVEKMINALDSGIALDWCSHPW